MINKLRDRSPWKKIGWFVLLWAGGVLAVTILSWIVRAAMPV